MGGGRGGGGCLRAASERCSAMLGKSTYAEEEVVVWVGVEGSKALLGKNACVGCMTRKGGGPEEGYGS